ncbi:MAG TPA: MASE1 domain-containing protein [Myxococcaceae bacterium]|nr:MASE1 domain-containing protein [Myxococcaceae bacterium]
MRVRADPAEADPTAGQARPGALAQASELILVFVAYVLSARLGLTLAPVSGFATLVWPPTGIALAALLLRGVRLWPALMLGALVANVWSGASFWVATGIGIGNTLEAILAVALLTRVARIHLGLDRLSDVLALVAFAAGLSTMVSATVGVAVLWSAGIAQPGHVGETWRAWWVGDALGDLVVAPVLLTWRSLAGLTLSGRRVLEALALVVAAVGLSCFVFLLGPPLDSTPFRQAHTLFPVLIWAALRYGPRGGTATILLISIFAIWGTLAGHGPFVGETPDLSLLQLQIFMAVASITALVLAATSTERMEALNAEQELLAIVSHDMRNPLGALRLGTRNLLNQPAGELGPHARRHGEFIARCAQRMESLIRNVLDSATIRTGHLSLVRTPQDLSALIHEAADTFRMLAEEKSQTLRVEVPPSLPLHGDRERLLQVLSNLLANAVKFAPSEGSITARAWVLDGWAHCSISDDGPGIGPDELERVFDPYWSAGSSRGTGLGLSIVKGLVEAHGGTTFVQSEPRMGTTVGFRLPLGAEQPSARDLLVPRVLSRGPKPG